MNLGFQGRADRRADLTYRHILVQRRCNPFGQHSVKNPDLLEGQKPEVYDSRTLRKLRFKWDKFLTNLIGREYETITLRRLRKLDLPRGRKSLCWPEGA